jgi:hypothetical protein
VEIIPLYKTFLFRSFYLYFMQSKLKIAYIKYSKGIEWI